MRLAKSGIDSGRGKMPSYCRNSGRVLDLIQIKAVSDTSSSVDAGSGTEAAAHPAITSQMGFSMSAAGDDRSGRPRRRRMEIFAFLFLTAVLLPAFAVATVGSYGLAVWVYQMMAGPPGPPTR
jgi:periplasmic nitrate reductase NapE